MHCEQWALASAAVSVTQISIVYTYTFHIMFVPRIPDRHVIECTTPDPPSRPKSSSKSYPTQPYPPQRYLTILYSIAPIPALSWHVCRIMFGYEPEQCCTAVMPICIKIVHEILVVSKVLRHTWMFFTTHFIVSKKNR